MSPQNIVDPRGMKLEVGLKIIAASLSDEPGEPPTHHIWVDIGIEGNLSCWHNQVFFQFDEEYR